MSLYHALRYEEPLYRPPSEGPNLIIQATIGCSFNRCAFCSMYRTKEYRAKPLDAVFADIDKAAEIWPQAHRVFLADGDALVLPTEDLLAICDHLQKRLPNLARVSCYATPSNLIKKSVEDLARLKEAKLSLVYLGVETGDPALLKTITKGASQKGHIEAMAKARESGLKVSATVILGLAGKERWREHILETAKVINEAPPTYLSTLQLYLEEERVEDFLSRYDDFQPQDDGGVLDELALLLENLEPPHPVIFRSNHASNALALAGNLPKDGPRLLAQVQAAQQGLGGLRPEWMRGL